MQRQSQARFFRIADQNGRKRTHLVVSGSPPSAVYPEGFAPGHDGQDEDEVLRGPVAGAGGGPRAPAGGPAVGAGAGG